MGIPVTENNLIVNNRATEVADWKKLVLERDKSTCCNCESKLQVAACFVVPPEAGGRVKLSNGITLCRDCRIVSESARVLPLRIDNKTPINFLISKKLHEAVDSYVHNGSNFGSISSLVRRMISSFITEPELYEDMAQWQDDGSEVKINGWVNGNTYLVF